jgi:hypothetical protein
MQAPRRTFLKVAAGAGTLAFAADKAPRARLKAADVLISAAKYTPAEYPIQAKPYSAVTIKDTFWQPKIKANAEVTIPFEVQKLTTGSARGMAGAVLKADILSQKVQQNKKLQMQVKTHIQTQ